MPAHAVIVGRESDGRPLRACRANHQGGVHPGKLVDDGLCHIGWGGRAVKLSTFELLTVAPGRWGPADDLTRAYVAGSENGKGIPICRVSHEGGIHPGKLIQGKCNIAYADRELELPTFEVLYVP